MRIRFETQLIAGTRWDDEAKTFVSHAPALNLYSQGPTETEAARAIESAVKLYLITAYEAGVLERILKRRGFSPPGGTSAIVSPKEYIRVLEERHFDNIIDVPASVDLAAR